MGLLSDVYSYGDTLKRKISDLAKNPGAALEQFVGQLGDDTNRTLSLEDQAGWGLGNKPFVSVLADTRPSIGFDPKIAAVTSQQRDSARFQLGEQGANSGIAGMFVGKGSKTWDAISAKKAEELSAKGVDPRKVWSETGTWKGPDGHWRQEIPDNAASITNSSTLLANDRVGIKAQLDKLVSDVKQSGGKPTDAQKFQANMLNMRHASTSYKGDISEAFAHDDLYKAYPEVAKTQFQWLPMPTGEGAQYSAREGVLLNGGKFGKEAESLTSHELQHAIQHKEGWATGGSPDDDSLMPYVRKMYTDNIDSFSGESHELINMAKHRAYQNLAGEAEARATQSRIPLDASQRRALFPEDSYDVPMDQLIVRGLLGK